MDKQEETKPEEKKLKDYYNFSTLFKLFIYNHIPKLLLTVVVIISFIEKDVMSYILFFFFLVFILFLILFHSVMLLLQFQDILVGMVLLDIISYLLL